MKVFLSWSGEHSKAAAAAFRGWLPLVLQYVKPWMSQHDIQAGSRWAVDVAGELSDCNFGIIFLTSDNINAPWLLFEAGALSKSVDEARVIPVLIGSLVASDVVPPLSQFQSKPFNKDGIREIVIAMNIVKGDEGLAPQACETLFDALWPLLDTDHLRAALQNDIKSQKIAGRQRSDSDLLEEILSIVRRNNSNLPDTLEDKLGVLPTRRQAFLFDSSLTAEQFIIKAKTLISDKKLQFSVIGPNKGSSRVVVEIWSENALSDSIKRILVRLHQELSDIVTIE